MEYLDEEALEENEIRGLVDESGLSSLLNSTAITPRHDQDRALKTSFNIRRSHSIEKDMEALENK